MRHWIILILFLSYKLTLSSVNVNGFYHEVKAGECLSSIASRYNLSSTNLYGKDGKVESIRKLNKNLKNYGHLIFPGQKIFIPSKNGFDVKARRKLIAHADPIIENLNENQKKIIVPVSVTDENNQTLKFVFDFNINLKGSVVNSVNESTVSDDRMPSATAQKTEVLEEENPSTTFDTVKINSQKKGVSLTLFGNVDLINKYQTLISSRNNSEATLGALPSYGVNAKLGFNLSKRWSLGGLLNIYSLEFKQTKEKNLKQDSNIFWGLGGFVRYKYNKQFSLISKGLFVKSSVLVSESEKLILKTLDQIELMFGGELKIYEEYLSLQTFVSYGLANTISNIDIRSSYTLYSDIKIKWNKNSDFGFLFNGNYKYLESSFSNQKEFYYGWGVYFDW
jgi:LysM repeat protein